MYLIVHTTKKITYHFKNIILVKNSYIYTHQHVLYCLNCHSLFSTLEQSHNAFSEKEQPVLFWKAIILSLRHFTLISGFIAFGLLFHLGIASFFAPFENYN